MIKIIQHKLTPYGVAILFGLLFGYTIVDEKSFDVRSKEIATLDTTKLQNYTSPIDINRSKNSFWGIKEPQLAEQEETNTSLEETELLRVTQEKNALCITDDCFRLLGTHYENKKAYVSLYNSKLKNKIKSFSMGDDLKEGVFVASIAQNEVVFGELNSSRLWSFRLFDVNTTKYKPQEKIDAFE